MPDPTPRQQAVLDYLQDHLAKRGYQPSVREIAAHFGWSNPNSVEVHLRALEQKGYIQRSRGRARSIAILEMARKQKR